MESPTCSNPKMGLMLMKLKHPAIIILLLLGLSSPLRSVELLCDFKADDLNSQPVVTMFESPPTQMMSGYSAGLPPYSDPEISAVWTGPTEWMDGSPNGGETFNWSLSKGIDKSGSNLDVEDYVKVSIVFDTGVANQTLCQVFRTDLYPGSPAAGVGTFPGQAWDMSDPLNPRRLNMCFREWDGSAIPNLQWDPDTSGSGNYEWLYIMLSDYDGTGLTYASSDPFTGGSEMDILYFFSPRVAEGHTFLESHPCTLTITPIHVVDFEARPDSSKMYLKWSYTGSGVVDHFDIYYGTSSPANIIAGQVPGTPPAYTHTGLEVGQTYFYRVEAIDSVPKLVGESKEIKIRAQIVAENMRLIGIWDGRSGPDSYGDCWGYTDSATGKEYGLLNHRSEGVSIIDLSLDPLEEVGFMPVVTASPDCHDVKVYKHYAILLAQFEPVQIFDISDVTNPIKVSEIILDGGLGAHNCMVDGDYLYIVGNEGLGGLEIFEITNPATPLKVGEFQPFYYHDLDIYKDTLIALGVHGEGIDILDISDKTAPSLIKRFNYPGSGAHNAEFLQGMNYVAIGDEIGTSGNWTRIFDLRDLDNISLVSEININSKAVVHNCYEKNGILYIAHYSQGAQLFNVTDPENPVKIGYYDTNLQFGPDNGGAWTVYPYFESGRIIVSDQYLGLFLLQNTKPDSCMIQMPGDVDGDRDIDANDVIALNNFLAENGPAPYPLANADYNGDCIINSLDVNQLADNIAMGAVPLQIVDCTCLEPIIACCIGSSGDINDDGTDANILDLTYLVDYVFRGGSPTLCDEKADLNNDGTPSNILDLTYIVDFIFRGGPAPGPCY